MTSDQNKKITGITYNILNLPSQIRVAGKGAIKYYYDAAGNKLQKRTTDNTAGPNTTVTTYIGGAVYQNDTLQFFGTSEGRVRANTAKTFWIYDYFLNDHLGNTRMIITDDYNVSNPILEANSYYPFGLQQKGIGLTAGSPLHNHKNTFQKQELNEDLGVYLYEFKCRMDDPQIGRFWQMDPLAEKYPNISPYAFVANNPIINIDPDGREIIGVTKKDAQNFKTDVYTVLADNKFANVRALIDVKGKTFKSIDAGALTKALDGVTLNTDERTYIDMVTNTINAKEEFKVEYVSGDFTSSEGAAAFKDYMNKTQPGVGDAMVTPEGNLSTGIIDRLVGLNVPKKDGSHSFISSKVQGNERATTSGHEVFGHGIPSAKGLNPTENNSNAIRTDNLIRRILGLPQRDGFDHGGYKEGQIIDPKKLPLTQ